MTDPAGNLPGAPLRKKHGPRRTRPGLTWPAHRFISGLVATLSTLRGSLERIYHPAGLNDRKFAVLSTLFAQAPKPSLATALARSTGITRASMTDLLDDLERRSWITRIRDRQDRRIIHIHLTALGRQVLTATEKHFEHLCETLLGATHPHELARLASLCERLSDSGRRLASSTPPFQPPSRL